MEAGLLPAPEGGFIAKAFSGRLKRRCPDTSPTLHHGLLANRNDVVGDEPSFTGNDQPHSNVFRFVVVASMQ